MKEFLKKNKTTIIIVGIFLILAGVMAFAIYRTANVKEPEIIIENNILKNYQGTSTEVLVNKDVKVIGVRAFEGKAKITKISFAEDSQIQAIAYEAFNGCAELVDIILPNGLQTIGGGAFKDCTSLETIIIPEGVTEIEPYAFSGCRNLKSISLPSTLEKLGENVFFECSSLTTITSKTVGFAFEDGVLYNGDKTQLIKYLPTRQGNLFEVPETVTSIANYAFQDAKELQYVTVGNNVEEIGYAIFEGCENITEISIPFVGKSITENRKLAYFFGNVSQNLKVVNVTNAITLGDDTFKVWTKLETINLSEGLVYIGRDAFKTCSKLAYVNIPSTVKSVGTNAFAGCNKSILIEVFNTEEYTQRWEPTWNVDGLYVEYVTK